MMKPLRVAGLMLLAPIGWQGYSCYRTLYGHIPLQTIVLGRKQVHHVSYVYNGCNYAFNKSELPEVEAFEKADWGAAGFTFGKTSAVLPSKFPVYIHMRLSEGNSNTRRFVLHYNPQTGLMLNDYSKEAAQVSPEFQQELARVIGRMVPVNSTERYYHVNWSAEE